MADTTYTEQAILNRAFDATNNAIETIGVSTATTNVFTGQVGSPAFDVSITPTLSAGAYLAGEVLFDTTAAAAVTRIADGKATLMTVMINDKDDQTAAGVDLVFLSSNVSLGTISEVPSISDANADNILGIVSVLSSDWIDYGGGKIATVRNINLQLTAASGTTTVYVAAIARGTPTQTAAGYTVRLMGLQH